MRQESRDARMIEIEAAAYDVITAQGYDGMSMLAVAKAAKASNETLYRWYGDKTGLFRAMVARNAQRVGLALDDAAKAGVGPLEQLERVAPVLLGMLLDRPAIALNRAAAGDVTGTLGAALAQEGRETVKPLFDQLLTAAVAEGVLRPPVVGDMGGLFLSLLVGDLQVRRVTGALPVLSPQEIRARADRAMQQFLVLCRV